MWAAAVIVSAFVGLALSWWSVALGFTFFVLPIVFCELILFGVLYLLRLALSPEGGAQETERASPVQLTARGRSPRASGCQALDGWTRRPTYQADRPSVGPDRKEHGQEERGWLAWSRHLSSPAQEPPSSQPGLSREASSPTTGDCRHEPSGSLVSAEHAGA